MFDYSKMIKRAIEFFPQWSDIRKRYKTSTGGKFIGSMLEESIKIEDAIQDYIDSYFLYNYIGHEDEVMAFVYMANIGILENLNSVDVSYNTYKFPFTDDIKIFENGRYVFYEEGKIYLNIRDYVEGIDAIQVSIDDVEASYKINKVHVWNIFDEFATFVNTRRYENESNKQLVDRILYITKNLPNGTEDGLKHAIISELMFDCPDITIDDIKIEGPTPENLVKAYEDYETLLDLLAEVNRDIYRTKRWDIDYWEYGFESIDYIPHVWDKVVKQWQNGVGTMKDLEVILADQSETTDATIYFYKKTLEAFQKYVYDKYIENNINFTMTKYNNILNKTKVLYKIQASELKDISYDNIYMQLFESENKTTEIPIQQIASGWGKDVVKINNDQRDENDRYGYKLRIRSKSKYDLKISKADIIYTHKDTDEVKSILNLTDKEQPGFVMNSEYEVVSVANKVSIHSIENFSSSEGLKNDDGCITIADGHNEGIGKLSLTNKAGLYVNYKYECQTVSLPEHLISCPGGYWNNDGEFVIRGDYSIEDKVMTINATANYLAFKISEENINARVVMELDDALYGKKTIELHDKLEFKTELSEKPRKISITINVYSINDVKFSDFEYSNYEVSLSTKYGKLEKSDKGYKLGNFYNNELTLFMTASTGCSPRVEGLFIGESFDNIIFETDDIPYIDNCIRTFDIVTNGIIDLVQLDANGIETGVVEEDYRPMTLYKATSDLAYIRIDLSEYESIDKVQLDVGSLEVIEESGRLYHNIRLQNNDVVGTITVKGTKAIEARIVTLRDLVSFYIDDFDPTYDKIYCSKCSQGLIISRQNPGGTPYNQIVTIKSEVFTGLDIIKYTMVLPSNLGTIYGTNSGNEYRMNTISNSFDYISIYPDSSQVYQAINEFNTCIRENRYIKITNNFSPNLDMSKLLFFKVELYDETISPDDILVRFHNDINAEVSIYDLPYWSVGTSNSYIAIQNNIDMLNNISYSATTYNIDDVNFLSSSVDIKDTYTLTDHTILNTEKYIIDTHNDNITIKYDYYDGTVKKSHLLKYEEVIVEQDGFNKLNYSNIDTIYHISKEPYKNEYLEDITEYKVLKDQGIIIWEDETLIKNNVKIYLVYSIRKPIAFVFDIDYLYKAIDFDVNAYSLFEEHELRDLKSGTILELTDYSSFDDTDLVYVSCTNPTFMSQLENKSEVTFNKFTVKNTLLVKTGYYYINGREYYLFSEENPEAIKNDKLYSSHNVDISGGEITTYKETNNYISNSEMRLKGTAELYNFDCSKPLTYGVSNFNNLTSCESFNDWNTFGMELKLVDGLNGLALNFTPTIDNGYSFIDITDFLVENNTNYISFYATKDLKVYAGIEAKYLYINFNRALNISIDHEIVFNNSDIRDTAITKMDNYRYYLIVQGVGTLDDIIISTDPDSVYGAHTKNISLLGFDLYEKKAEGTRYKMMIRSDRDYVPYGAGLMSDGSIKTTSNIDWYVTQIYTLSKNEEFRVY